MSAIPPLLPRLPFGLDQSIVLGPSPQAHHCQHRLYHQFEIKSPVHISPHKKFAECAARDMIRPDSYQPRLQNTNCELNNLHNFTE